MIINDYYYDYYYAYKYMIIIIIVFTIIIIIIMIIYYDYHYDYHYDCPTPAWLAEDWCVVSGLSTHWVRLLSQPGETRPRTHWLHHSTVCLAPGAKEGGRFCLF